MEEKYLKYKNKYLSLKNSLRFTQYGGAGGGGGGNWACQACTFANQGNSNACAVCQTAKGMQAGPDAVGTRALHVVGGAGGAGAGAGAGGGGAGGGGGGGGGGAGGGGGGLPLWKFETDNYSYDDYSDFIIAARDPRSALKKMMVDKFYFKEADAERALLNHERGIPVKTGFSPDYQAIYFETHNYLEFFTVVPIRISDSSIYREPTVVCASFHAG